MSFPIKVSTTAPVDAETTTLFDTTTAFGLGSFRHLQSVLKRISFGTHNSHSGTLNASRSIDGGTNWRVYSTQAIAASAANTISGPYDFLVDTYLDWKLEWVNGGTTQTTWRPEMQGHPDRVPGT